MDKFTQDKFTQLAEAKFRIPTIWKDHIRPHILDAELLKSLYRPMNLKLGSEGGFSIAQLSASRIFDVVNFRTSYLLGIHPVKIEFDEPLSFHRLLGENRGVMTSDTPIEVYSQIIAFRQAYGNVLVSGLGLGMATKLLSNLPGVDRIFVVEKEKAIINLIEPQIRDTPKLTNIFHADIFKFLDNPKIRFDFAYHDVWYETNEGTWVDTIVPLWRKTRRAGIADIGGWGELDMVSQMFTGLCHSVVLGSHRWKPYRVYLKAVRKAGIEIPTDNLDNPKLIRLAKLFLFDVGSKKWERTFDWGKG